MELGLGFTADNGQVVINDDKIIITLNRNDHHDVSGILSGSFVGSILNDNKNEHSIHFENQAISIGEDVHSPLHLTSDAILSF
jgi:hypothetical protein